MIVHPEAFTRSRWLQPNDGSSVLPWMVGRADSRRRSREEGIVLWASAFRGRRGRTLSAVNRPAARPSQVSRFLSNRGAVLRLMGKPPNENDTWGRLTH